MRDQLEVPGGLWLRRWADRDAQAIVTAFADPLMRGQATEPPVSKEAAERWLGDQDERWQQGSLFSFAVVDAQDAAVGSVAVGAIDRRHATGWVSYWTTPAVRGTGAASRACRVLARWAFDEAGLFRLELGHRVNNPASCAVARAAGFAVEGLERQKLEYDAVRYDVELHARLATDPDPDPDRPLG